MTPTRLIIQFVMMVVVRRSCSRAFLGTPKMATVKHIQHEGYVAEVSGSIEDCCYYAQLINAPRLSLLAEGETLDDLLEAFASLISNYLKAVSNDGFGLVQPRDLVTG